MLSFKPAVSLSSFIFIKRFFSFSSLSAIRVVSSGIVVKSQILETDAGFYTHSVVDKLGGSKEVA